MKITIHWQVNKKGEIESYATVFFQDNVWVLAGDIQGQPIITMKR